jgi:hypothetical protein
MLQATTAVHLFAPVDLTISFNWLSTTTALSTSITESASNAEANAGYVIFGRRFNRAGAVIHMLGKSL